MMKLKRQQQGFTLLEVMVVIIIIATISGFSVLALTQATSRRYINHADNLLVWFEQISELAVLESTAYGVIRNEDHLQAMVFYRNRWHRAAQPSLFPLDDFAILDLDQASINSTQLFQQNKNLEEQRLPDFIFLPNGFIEPETTMELHFANQTERFRYSLDNNTAQFVMEPLLGDSR